MTVFKPKRAVSFRYDFWYLNTRYQGSTHQTTREKAQRVEARIKQQLREQAGGIASVTPDQSPRFEEWAEVYYAYKSTDGPGKVDRPDHIKHVLLPLLRFWGAPAEGETSTTETPFHDLRLVDPIRHPDWILQFEQWMTERGIAGQTRNHYRSVLSRMYQVALLPQYRQVSGVMMNPFAGLPRDVTVSRDVTLTPAQVQAWLSHASYHVRLAVAIAALAPKLRLSNVLQLRWDEHLDKDLTYITVTAHKTARRTGRPLVTPISAQLRKILKDARQRRGASPYVVTYHGKPVKDITFAVAAAAKAAGIPYGRARTGGATFHTLRHTASTLLAGMGTDPFELRGAMGHTDIATTMKYTHLQPTHEKPPLERLSRSLKIAAIVTQPRLRALRDKLRDARNDGQKVPGNTSGDDTRRESEGSGKARQSIRRRS